ncbi:Trypsin [Oryctes borbonicus]|uniref:Trypsin n=1 Tax=Oryctes borbonicus TaxID=1629725 RepID=A0A0T6B9L8_9SCAR|nr:Trypsin [Oryctes borbonicus]
MGMIEKNIGNEEDDYVIIEDIIKRFIKHPDYKKPLKYNDIALVELTKNVEFTPFIRPACLNVRSTLEERSLIAVGFGKTAMENEEGSQVLKKVTLDLISHEECGPYFPSRPAMKIGVVSSMLCAGFLKGGKDTCHGDSGGPIQVILEDPYCMYSIVGVTSFGTFCGYENSPAIYSNVSHFIPWIEEIVW